jgi:hypothetical protein
MLRIALCLSSLLYATAWADITVTGTHSPGFGGGIDRQVIYLRENQMRIDQLPTLTQDGRNKESVVSSLLIRFSGRPSGLLFIDHDSMRVQMVSSLREINAAQTADAGSDPSVSSVRVVKRDQTREILGHTAHRYDFAFAGNVDPLVLLGQQLSPGMAGLISIKLQLTGTSWVAPDMEGARELAAFFAQLSRRQLTIGMPGPTPPETAQQLSLLSPGLSSALTEVLAQITTAGFPLLTQTHSDIRVDMEGAMADMIQGMLDAMGIGGSHSTESVVTGVRGGNVPPELFYDGLLPPGYSLNTPR